MTSRLLWVILVCFLLTLSQLWPEIGAAGALRTAPDVARLTKDANQPGSLREEGEGRTGGLLRRLKRWDYHGSGCHCSTYHVECMQDYYCQRKHHSLNWKCEESCCGFHCVSKEDHEVRENDDDFKPPPFHHG